MSSVTFPSIPISRQNAPGALAKFDAAYGAGTNAYDGWMDNGSH